VLTGLEFFINSKRTATRNAGGLLVLKFFELSMNQLLHPWLMVLKGKTMKPSWCLTLEVVLLMSQVMEATPVVLLSVYLFIYLFI
jgi:hypothetical protein